MDSLPNKRKKPPFYSFLSFSSLPSPLISNWRQMTTIERRRRKRRMRRSMMIMRVYSDGVEGPEEKWEFNDKRIWKRDYLFSSFLLSTFFSFFPFLPRFLNFLLFFRTFLLLFIPFYCSCLVIFLRL